MQPGAQRRGLDRTLRAAYSEGLLSQGTFVHRLGRLVTPGLIDPEQLVGDLRVRGPSAPLSHARTIATRLRERTVSNWRTSKRDALLALDWAGGIEQLLLVGRSGVCDVRLDDPSVSRLHARLIFRDGAWVVQDLRSRNGTVLNGSRVVRSQLRPGDRIAFAGQRFRID
jgi:FHA domain